MRSRVSRRDWGLTWRMWFVMAMLAVVYLAFVAILSGLGVPWIGVGIVAGIMLFVQFFFSDRLVLWSMGAKVVTPEQEPKLHAMVDRLVEQAGMRKPKVAVANSEVPNAFATGRGPRNAVICVTTGIRRRLTDEELEGVLGHELTHVVNRDVLVITLASFFATVAAMLMQMLFWMGLFGGMGRSRDREGGGGGAIMIAYVASVAVYFIANLLILALSRYREYAADRGGAILTGAPSRLASALEKISGAIARIPTEDLRKVEGANAFFIVSALKGDSLAGLFSSHPPVHKRVERLRKLERELEGF
ncbi:MAG: zinc metalloprotease HtpX [Dehalococcoidia bacterium]|nr:zinc metalloprotease HtpX [Dehalococcoidia bacterium]